MMLWYRMTTTMTLSIWEERIADWIGLPAVPDGSPSSLQRLCCPTLKAQQLWVARGSLTSERKEKADSSSEMGAAMAMNLLFFISFSKLTLSAMLLYSPWLVLLLAVMVAEAALVTIFLKLVETATEADRPFLFFRTRWW